jgi:hypothetical protein
MLSFIVFEINNNEAFNHIHIIIKFLYCKLTSTGWNWALILFNTVNCHQNAWNQNFPIIFLLELPAWVHFFVTNLFFIHFCIISIILGYNYFKIKSNFNTVFKLCCRKSKGLNENVWKTGSIKNCTIPLFKGISQWNYGQP